MGKKGSKRRRKRNDKKRTEESLFEGIKETKNSNENMLIDAFRRKKHTYVIAFTYIDSFAGNKKKKKTKREQYVELRDAEYESGALQELE